MTTDAPTAAAGGSGPAGLLDCPRCRAPLPGGEGPWACSACRTTGALHVFAPPPSRATLVPGEGRCAAHPGKDAVDTCERCGAFACEVCRTRTGERTLCPPCFETLHERGELATTQARRIRWDRLTTTVFVLSLFCSPFGLQLVTLPLACALAVWALWKRRTEPYLSAVGPVVVLSVTALITAAFVIVLLAAASR